MKRASTARSLDVRVETWRELQEALYAHGWDAGIGRFRPQRAFRGIGLAHAELTTALMRLGGDYARHERNLLRSFRKYARLESPCVTIWDWLAVAQHHGLPTRLLDWTFSPQVAMHFATANSVRANEDGVIWAVDYGITNRYLPSGLRRILEEEDAQVFSAEMLAGAAQSLEKFDTLAKNPFVAFFEPPSLDQRIVNQFALFSLMSRPSGQLDAFLEQVKEPRAVMRILIPAKLKPEVRDKLDQANVTERVLFPGLDGLCQWLRRYYSPGEVPESDAQRGPAGCAPGRDQSGEPAGAEAGPGRGERRIALAAKRVSLSSGRGRRRRRTPGRTPRRRRPSGRPSR